jgi:hypothetical protein
MRGIRRIDVLLQNFRNGRQGILPLLVMSPSIGG